MKTALVTTTINEPTFLRAYRAAGPSARIFVVGDQKTPHADVFALTDQLGNAVYLPPEMQQHWKVSEPIGWGKVARRNIGYLEALKWGADIIISCDDDNLVLDHMYFCEFEQILSAPFTGLEARSDNWFDVGTLMRPPAVQRGIPQESPRTHTLHSAHRVNVGVAQGICLGDPDTSAVDRLSQRPDCHLVSEFLRAGIVTDPRRTRTVFNTQVVAFRRELTPAMLLVPQFGRYDDIFASLVTQRVMANQNLHVHFGRPFVCQQRNDHDLTADLEAELFGMRHAQDFANWLNSNLVADRIHEFKEPYRCAGEIYAAMAATWPHCPPGVASLADAWFEDLQGVL